MKHHLLKAALQYQQNKLSVLPAKRAGKRPCIGSWKQYQQRLPTQTELDAWFSNPQDGICIITGTVSGNLEIIDFDNGGELFDAWYALIPADLRSRLVIEQTPSGGWHVIYRCESEISGNMKLAQRKDGSKIHTLVETRGEGGLFLCAPTAGYELMQGELTDLPVLAESDREILLEAAWSLNEYIPEPIQHTNHSDSSNLRPGDDYNSRGNVVELLKSHGWQFVNASGENQRWRRPEKVKGWSATLRTTDNVFYVFSSNAAPFESNSAYSPFMVYSLLEHGGDCSKAALELSKQGYGEPASPPESDDVDLSGILSSPDVKPKPELIDPGQLPDELLRIPGFVSELMDFCLETAPYPNLGLAFCGALTMQSFLCGRKVRDPGNLRTNIYLLALAGSSSGKDWPRQINAHIFMEIGKTDALGDKFASGEGIQDAMNLTPSMLFQNDEIDGMLIALNKSRDGRFESIMGTLLTMFTSSGSVYPMRRKAGKQSGGIIDQPHLTIFGTATPKYYYESLSERMLSNGFFARMMVVDIGYRGKGKDAGLIDTMPKRILETAKWWDDYCPGQRRGNLISFHPKPEVIPIADAARDVLDEFRYKADSEYAKSEAENDESAKSIWGRANENARKLALLFAASESYQSPEISQQGATWAVTFAEHQIRRMLYLVGQHVFENEFDKKCKQMMKILTAWKKQKGQLVWMPHWEIARRLKGWNERDFEMVRDSLSARLEIEYEDGSTPNRGRNGIRYRVC